ncbi:MAG: hypothetical protein M3Z32_03605 [Acidobacteriota bacterium]|nr:hypothetical protein [Acidobacteriota bacterium]
MQSALRNTIVASGLLLFGFGMNAQARYDYGRGREPLDRVRADLDRAARDMRYLSGGDFRRFDHARQEIREFQEKWERGRFDRHELDDVIGSLQSVVRSNRIRPRHRDLLMDDLARLRDFRARSSSGYRNDRYEPWR